MPTGGWKLQIYPANLTYSTPVMRWVVLAEVVYLRGKSHEATQVSERGIRKFKLVRQVLLVDHCFFGLAVSATGFDHQHGDRAYRNHY